MTLAVAAMLYTTGCVKKDTDTTPPVADILTPVNGQQFPVNCDSCGILLNAELTDDVLLSEYKIEIHSAAGHGSHVSLLRASTTVWAFDTIVSLAGKSNATIDLSILLKNVSDTGAFHFLLYVTDKAGNEVLEERDIVLKK